MVCLHCGNRLPLLKQISNGGFCSEAHRAAFAQEQESLVLSRLLDDPEPRPKKGKATRNGLPKLKDATPAVLLQFMPTMVPAADCRKEPANYSHNPAEFQCLIALPRMEIASSSSHLDLAGGCPGAFAKLSSASLAPTVCRADEPPLTPLGWTSVEALDGRPSSPVSSLTQAAEETPARIPPIADKPALASVQAQPAKETAQSIPPMAAKQSTALALRQPPKARICVNLPQPAFPTKVCAFPQFGLPDGSGGRTGQPGSLPALESAFQQTTQLPPPSPHPQGLPKSWLAVDPGDHFQPFANPVLPAGAGQPPARLGFGSLYTLDSKKLVIGPRKQLVWTEPENFRTPKCARPVVQTGTKTHLPLVGRRPLPLLVAQWGDRCITLPLECEPPARFLVAPKSTKSGGADFDPPLFGKRPTQMAIPRSDPKRWIFRFPAQGLPAELQPRQYSGRRARILCDWVPVMTPLLPLHVNIDWQDSPVVTARPDPGDFTTGQKSIFHPATTLPAAAGGNWTLRTSQQCPLSIDRIVPTQSAGGAKAVLIPEILLPAIQTHSTGFGLLLSRNDVIGAVAPGSLWEENLNRVRSAWRGLGAVPRWALTGLTVAILAGVLSPGRGATEDGTANASVGNQWQTIQTQILKRAAISITDDFRNGLSEWDGKGDWARDWSYDAAGFVRPGPLALLTSSQVMADYRMELLGQIEKKSIGWVVRAADTENYYSIKLTVLDPSPVPEVVIERNIVLGGKPGPVRTKRLPIEVRNDTVYRIGTEVRGNNYVLTVQDQVVDSWSDPNLPTGGIGLFSTKGEVARVRWVGIWHQYDTLGRLCAYLAPPALQGKQKEE